MGLYEPHGDGAADIHLLIHLYKTQIRELARYLGVPQEIVNKPSSGDLAAGLPNEAIIGLSYEQLDRVLCGLHHGIVESEIMARAGVKRRAVRGIRHAMAVANLRRSLPARLPDVDEMVPVGISQSSPDVVRLSGRGRLREHAKPPS
jgi:NAD+ synthase